MCNVVENTKDYCNVDLGDANRLDWTFGPITERSQFLEYLIVWNVKSLESFISADHEMEKHKKNLRLQWQCLWRKPILVNLSIVGNTGSFRKNVKQIKAYLSGQEAPKQETKQNFTDFWTFWKILIKFSNTGFEKIIKIHKAYRK